MSSLHIQQFKALLKLETRKTLWGKRGVPTLLIAFLPVAFFSLVFLVSHLVTPLSHKSGEALSLFAMIFQILMLRSVIYFGIVWIFMNLFRADMLDKSLHFLFLSPIRRETLVVGKFLSAFLCASLLFIVSTTASLLIFHATVSFSDLGHFFTQQNGFFLVLKYDFIVLLACLGYGATFLLIGLLFRNAIVPAVLIYLWEWANFLLPSVLKKISIVYYLKALEPIPVKEGALALASDPISGPAAVFGVVAIAVAMILLAVWKIRRMELDYGKES
jgi:ABC-type transport system involved in multi-copper enzyme maturation permease subunit